MATEVIMGILFIAQIAITSVKSGVEYTKQKKNLDKQIQDAQQSHEQFKESYREIIKGEAGNISTFNQEMLNYIEQIQLLKEALSVAQRSYDRNFNEMKITGAFILITTGILLIMKKFDLF